MVEALFAKAGEAEITATPEGTFVTAIVVAGGSAGAMVLFQGVLNFSKDARKAMVAAKQADAQAALAEAKKRLRAAGGSPSS